MLQFELYVPVVDNNGRPYPSVQTAVEKALLDKFGGYTCYSTRGGYVGKDNARIIEIVYVYRILADDSSLGRIRFAEDTISRIANYVKAELHQESVLVTQQAISATFLQ